MPSASDNSGSIFHHFSFFTLCLLSLYVSYSLNMAQKSIQDEFCNASAKGNLTEVLKCIEKGASINGLNIYKRTALQVVKWGHSQLVAALLCAGADHTVRDPVCGLTVLHDSAREGFEDSVRVLLQHGADVDARDNHGNLPVDLAASKGHTRVVKLLSGHYLTDDASETLRGYSKS